MRLHPFLTVCLLVVLPAIAARAADAPRDEYAKPHDFILAVDVSFSMTGALRAGAQRAKELSASDPDGIRWDGAQFAIDVARPQDRIALVIFRGEAIVLTRYLDPSGFVTLDDKKRYGGKTGREALRALVAEIQAGEVRVAGLNRGKAVEEPNTATFDYNSLSTLPRPAGDPLLMWSGTSVVFALEQIDKELLPRTGGDRQGYVLLFTDGFEANPFGLGGYRPDSREEAKHGHRPADYAYVQELLRHKDDPAGLGKLVEGYVKGFRTRRVPVFTFGLGEDCDLPFLQLISEKSTAGDVAVPAESNHARTSTIMFDQLRPLVWELQQYWRGSPEAIRRPTEDAFRTPPVGGWHDLGVLLFAEKPGPSGRTAVAPESVTVRAVRGQQEAPALPVRASRSHHYYYLAPDSPVKAAVGPGARLELALKRSEPLARCSVVLRTEHSLFTYRRPETDNARYTPKDAIPIEVDFRPDQGGLFRPEHFEVQVTVRPAPEPGRPVRRTSDAVRVPLVLTPGQPVFRYEPSPGDPGLVLDADPRSTGVRDLVGPYTVDVTLKGAKEGPLDGYERRLIRRTFRVREYPALKAGVESLTLSNDGESPAIAALPVEIDLATTPPGPIATVMARVERGPSLPGGEPLPAELFRWRHGTDLAEGNELQMLRPKGDFALELPAEKWAALAPGEYDGGVVLIRAPWEEKATRVPFRVRKVRYKVTAQSPAFDLSGAGPVRQTVLVTLKTLLPTQEVVRLSAEKDAGPDAAPGDVTFTAVKGGGEVKLRVRELGQEMLVSGKFQAPREVPLVLAAGEKLPPGRYRRTFWLTGPAIDPTPVPVEVVTDQPGVLVAGPDGGWARGPNEAPRPQHEVTLLGLAGTRVRRTFALYSPEQGKPLSSRAVLDALGLTGGKDRLPVKVQEGPAERIDLDVAVPLEVEEGTYTSRLKLVDPSRRPPLPSREAELLVRLQVVHYGVSTEDPGPVRLKFAEAGPAVATAPIKVVTPSEKVPVRWWVEQVDPAELTKEGHEGQVLPLGLLDVKSIGGVSVLGQKPKEPLFHDKPFPLAVEARCARLAQGLYRSKLRFYVRADEPGAPYELDVTVLVPGRRIELLAPSDPRCNVGQDAERHVRVSCWDCEPGQGVWQALDIGGTPAGPEQPVRRLVKSEDDARIPGVRHHTFAFSIRPERAGKNGFRVAWPAHARDNPTEGPLAAVSQVNARGLIVMRPRFGYPGEQVTIEVLADPSSVPGKSLELEAVNRSEIDKSPTPIALAPAGDGRFTAQYSFDRLGVYEIRLAPNGPPGLLEPVRVSAAFTLDVSASLGTIDYGGGSLASLFGVSKQEVSVPGAVRLTNEEGRKCRWKARLRYPATVVAARDIFNQDPEQTTARYDEAKHLQTRLIGPVAGESAEGEWSASGTLDDHQTLELGIESKLSEPAQSEVWSGSRGHPTLDSVNGMMVEVALEWLDDAGQTVEQRTVCMPFVVSTGRGWTMWLLLAALPVLPVAGYFLWRRYQSRRRILAASRPAAGAGEEHLTGLRPAPAPDLAPPNAGGPPPGDDLLPDYLRGD